MVREIKVRVGFIGFGRMGSALAQGVLAAGVSSASQLAAFDLDLKAREMIKKFKIKGAKDASQVVALSDFVFLCVKPQQMRDVLKAMAATVRTGKEPVTCFASIAAGVSLARLQEGLGPRTPIFRIMPNTPAFYGAGVSAVSQNEFVTPRQKAWVETMLKSVGDVLFVPESSMDAITAVSGSGPAYAFYLAEAMMEGAVELGLSKEVAKTLVHQTLYGAGVMLKKSAQSALDLRLQVTSPGGTTAEAVNEFENKGLKAIIGYAMEKAAGRAKELSEGV